MTDELEARLKSHAETFEGLMSLIPAKHYYGEDTNDQWPRKKQSKEAKRQAKKAKLDPVNQKTAKDVMDENERKRKREDEDAEGESGVDTGTKEQPREGLKRKKLNERTDADAKPGPKGNTSKMGDTTPGKTKAEKRKEKREKSKAKAAKQLDRFESKKARKGKEQEATLQTGGKQSTQEADDAAEEGVDTAMNDIERVNLDGFEDAHDTSTTVSPNDSPVFDTTNRHSATSSVSSIAPPIIEIDQQKLAQPLHPPTAAKTRQAPSVVGVPDPIPIASPSRESGSESPLNGLHRLPKVDQEVLKSRLQARIDALRAARNADGPNGKPARTRQELIEARRKKEEQRRALKKQLRQKAKEEERLKSGRHEADEEARKLSGSMSPGGSQFDIFANAKEQENNFSFGRLAFDDGTQVDPSLGRFVDPKKRKGTQDPRTALEIAERKKARLSGLDESKRAEIEEKDRWLNARKHIHGERVRDDTSLLKKTLKRKEKVKGRSEREWQEREEGVRKGQEFRQKRREENIRKRRDEKEGGKKKKATAGKGGPSKGKRKARPGFEGSFKARPKKS